jgi:hypothetical protein
MGIFTDDDINGIEEAIAHWKDDKRVEFLRGFHLGWKTLKHAKKVDFDGSNDKMVFQIPQELVGMKDPKRKLEMPGIRIGTLVSAVHHHPLSLLNAAHIERIISIIQAIYLHPDLQPYFEKLMKKWEAHVLEQSKELTGRQTQLFIKYRRQLTYRH